MMSKPQIAKYAISFQGVYYLLTGLWALVSIDSFNRVVGHVHEGPAFEMHSIAAMSVVLGLYFLHVVRKKDWFKTDIAYLVMGIAFAVVAVELVYLPGMGWNLFWLDIVEEAIIVLLLLWVVKR